MSKENKQNYHQQSSVITTTVGHYLLYCLKKLGIRHLFGVPGDYQLHFLDQVLSDGTNQQLNDQIEALNAQDNKKIIWMGDTNELNAAYAANAYSQINPYRMGALLTTAGVGELSALNPVAGSYAEYHGLIHIVGHPSLPAQANHKRIHHGLDETTTTNFKKIASLVSLIQIQITSETAIDDIAYALNLAYYNKRPVYLFLPSGEEKKIIEIPMYKLYQPHMPKSDPIKLENALNAVIKALSNCQNAVVILDQFIARYKQEANVDQFLEKTKLPFLHTLLAKGIIDESKDNCRGIYLGDVSTPEVKKYVETADLLLFLGGYFETDVSTGWFSQNFSQVKTLIQVMPNVVKINDLYFTNVWIYDFIPALIAKFKISPNVKKQISLMEKEQSYSNYIKNIQVYQSKKPDILEQNVFWSHIQDWIPKNSIVLTGVGTAIWAPVEMVFKENVTWVANRFWNSIGYALPATLGTAAADSKRRSICFIGDGAFQMTGQAIATMLAHNYHPIIFLLNNDGYTIERIINGETQSYNNIYMWDYSLFAKSLAKPNPNQIWTASIKNDHELTKILKIISDPEMTNKLIFIEVNFSRMDYPKIMDRVFKYKPKVNLYED